MDDNYKGERKTTEIHVSFTARGEGCVWCLVLGRKGTVGRECMCEGKGERKDGREKKKV